MPGWGKAAVSSRVGKGGLTKVVTCARDLNLVENIPGRKNKYKDPEVGVGLNC